VLIPKESQLKEMEELFNLMDDNKDGVVSKREMYNLMKKMGQDPTKQVCYIQFYITNS
jgi:Ca2+-binding EF-hand superfamily protein